MTSDRWLAALDARLAQQLQFLLVADRLKSVLRGSRIADGSRRENTAEHSWHLALFSLGLREWAVGEFEAAISPDAKFAKALDRLQPILLNHAVGGGTWTDYAVDVAQERGLTRRIAEGAPALWDAAEAVFADAIACGWLRPAVAAAVS